MILLKLSIPPYFKVLAFLLFSITEPPRLYSQDTITICKDVRNIVFTIYTTQGKAVAWDWTLNGGVYSGSKSDSFCGPVSYPNIGIFSATCNVTFSTGKDSLHRFIIKVFDGSIKPISLNDTILCGAVNLTLDAGNAGNPIVKYKWQPGGQTSRQISVNQPGSYSVSVYTVDDYSYKCVGCIACDSAVATASVSQGTRPAVNLGPDRFICNNNPVTLDPGVTGIKYLWTPNGEQTQSIITAIPGTYGVTVTNSDGCTGSDHIVLKDSCPMFIFLPNAFTADLNGINDSFNWVGNMQMKDYNIVIYNRWGQKMFESSDAKQGWDGKYNGKNCPQGVYIYLLKCIDTREERHVLKGIFTLLK